MWLDYKSGTSRRVILIGKLAIKFAKAKHNGRKHNIGEFFYSTINGKSEVLCPVLCSLFNGWIIIMPRCRTQYMYPVDKMDEIRKKLEVLIPCVSDVKPSNIGFLNDKLVSFDYYLHNDQNL